MSIQLSPQQRNRFSGQIRHYHRAQTGNLKTWEEWIEGKAPKARPPLRWNRILGFIVGGLMLAGVISSLITELT